MKNLIKSVFISSYTSLLAIAGIYTAIQLWEYGPRSFWLGVAVAIWPALFFFVRLFLSPIARTSANLNWLLASAFLGFVLSLLLATNTAETLQALGFAGALGVLGAILYIYWYSRLGRTQSKTLQTGAALPAFSLLDANGQTWHSKDLQGPALLLFFRGNWCPLCMAQIKEVAAEYQTLEAMGVSVYLISPQPEKNTRSLASKFDVHYHFMTDRDNNAAASLGLVAENGTPKGLEVLGYDSDTVLPTAVLTGADGTVIYTDQTDNYRVRPEPATFLKVFREHGITPASS